MIQQYINITIMNIDNSHPPSISEESPTKKESQLLC